MRKFLLPALLALTVGACSDSTGPEEPFVGTYTLFAVDGKDLPALLFETDGNSYEVVSGTFTIRDNGAYASTVAVRVVEAGVESVFPAASSGTYLSHGSEIEFISQGGNFIAGHFSGNQLSVTDEGAARFDFSR